MAGDPRDPEHRPDPAKIQSLEQITAACDDLPDQLTTGFGVALAELTAAMIDRGIPVPTIVGALHGVVTETLAPLLVQQQLEATGAVEHKHRWGAGLGPDFVFASVEDHGDGMRFQVCPDCGARRQV